MPHFFVEPIVGERTVLTGEDARHIGKSLRMKTGEELTLCDGRGTDYQCVILSVGDAIELRVLERRPNRAEPKLTAVLYQALPKSDKMEWIIQKAVELGVSRIVPVLTSRCISRPDQKSMDKKIQRYQKIALEAAKQSGRGKIPLVDRALTLEQALEDACQYENQIFLYEGGGSPLKDLIKPNSAQAALFIGSEGGFAPEEVELARQKGFRPATLGPRILRCETAPLCALSILMNITGDI